MYEIRRISILALARIVALITSVVYALTGVCLALLYGGIRATVIGQAAPDGMDGMSFLLVWLSGLVIVIPVSLILGVLIAALYNLFARWWGGLRIDLTKVNNAPEAKPPIKKESSHAEKQ